MSLKRQHGATISNGSSSSVQVDLLVRILEHVEAMAPTPQQELTEACPTSDHILPAIQALSDDSKIPDEQKAFLFRYLCENPDRAVILPVNNPSFCISIFQDILSRHPPRWSELSIHFHLTCHFLLLS